jgi:hypothetical protein
MVQRKIDGGGGWWKEQHGVWKEGKGREVYE